MIKPSLFHKMEAMLHRHEEVSALLSEPHVLSDAQLFQKLSREYGNLKPLAEDFLTYSALQQQLNDLDELGSSGDMELRDLAESERPILNEKLTACEERLYAHLLPVDPHDGGGVFLEIRAAAGGDESAIFAGDLFRMYSRYSESQKWRVEVISAHEAEKGGYKEIVARISGAGVYGQLKFESGAHRVQRVPVTESQGRVHTSTCTVAVLADIEDDTEIHINPQDLKIDTYRASGAGGQHVNKTDSAIRITHLPSGLVVECQEERSQHKNRAKAMALLQARLENLETTRLAQEKAQTRRLLVGTGDRSERIRTYNFPQGRMTDHRIGLTLYQLGDLMEGDLEAVLSALHREYRADQLADLNEGG